MTSKALATFLCFLWKHCPSMNNILQNLFKVKVCKNSSEFARASEREFAMDLTLNNKYLNKLKNISTGGYFE